MVPFAIGMPGPWELGLVLLIVMMLFGVGKLPQVFEQFGKSIKAFKDAQKEDDPKQLADAADLRDAEEVKAKQSVER